MIKDADSSTPNYYAIIPAFVRYDEELSPNAKLLYGEITALSNFLGYCWANNTYFSKLYSVSTSTIKRLLKQLCDKKYIRIEVSNNNSRKIYVNDTQFKNRLGGSSFLDHPQLKNELPYNNINKYTKEEYNETRVRENFSYNWLEDDL